jgi:hypothetical protein
VGSVRRGGQWCVFGGIRFRYSPLNVNGFTNLWGFTEMQSQGTRYLMARSP